MNCRLQVATMFKQLLNQPLISKMSLLKVHVIIFKVDAFD